MWRNGRITPAARARRPGRRWRIVARRGRRPGAGAGAAARRFRGNFAAGGGGAARRGAAYRSPAHLPRRRRATPPPRAREKSGGSGEAAGGGGDGGGGGPLRGARAARRRRGAGKAGGWGGGGLSAFCARGPTGWATRGPEFRAPSLIGNRRVRRHHTPERPPPHVCTPASTRAWTQVPGPRPVAGPAHTRAPQKALREERRRSFKGLRARV